MNLDLTSFTVTAPGAAGTAMAAVAGDPSVVRNGIRNTLIAAMAMWTNSQAAGFTQVLWPSGHDLVRGVRCRNLALQPDMKTPAGYADRFRAQDPLTITQAGSATAGDIETFHILMYYDQLPGVNARLINLAELRRRGVDRMTVEDSSTAAAGGTYGGQRTLNQAADLFKADTDYALVGGVVGANCGALCIRGVDTGNLRTGFPGLSQDANVTGNWFIMLSEANDLPLIPVFNSANRAGIFIDQVNNELVPAVPFSLNFVELAPKAGGA